MVEIIAEGEEKDKGERDGRDSGRGGRTGGKKK